MGVEILDNGTRVLTAPGAMFGTDALLLGRFAQPRRDERALDLCSGCGIVALLTRVGLTYDQIAGGFEKTKIVASRFEDLHAGDLHIIMQMAKGQNPIACARCYSYVAQYPGEDKAVAILVDDIADNDGNSESTCWLYDCDYSYLADPSIGQIVFGGPRCRDQYLRALLAGVSPEKMQITENSAETGKLLDTDRFKTVFVLHELYRPEDAKVIKRDLIARGQEAQK